MNTKVTSAIHRQFVKARAYLTPVTVQTDNCTIGLTLIGTNGTVMAYQHMQLFLWLGRIHHHTDIQTSQECYDIRHYYTVEDHFDIRLHLEKKE